jgi:hypothetical protein
MGFVDKALQRRIADIRTTSVAGSGGTAPGGTK